MSFFFDIVKLRHNWRCFMKEYKIISLEKTGIENAGLVIQAEIAGEPCEICFDCGFDENGKPFRKEHDDFWDAPPIAHLSCEIAIWDKEHTWESDEESLSAEWKETVEEIIKKVLDDFDSIPKVKTL